MKIKEKFNSAETKVLAFFVASIILYSILLFILIGERLNSGLIKNAQQTLENHQTNVLVEIDNATENLHNTLLWLQNAYQNDYEEKGEDATFINGLCRTAMKFFGLKNVIFLDADGNQISSRQFGFGELSELVEQAAEGDEVYDIVKTGPDIFAMGAVPVYYDDEITGFIIGKTNITNDDFVENLCNSFGIEVTIFDGYTQKYTSFEDLKGEETEDTDIIDRVMEGEIVTGKEVIDGVAYVTAYLPIKDASENVLAAIFLGEPLDIVDELSSAIFIPLLITAILFTVILVALLIWVIYAFMIKKLKFVGKSIEELSSGDADLTTQLPVKGSDEFAGVSNNVNKFISMLREIVVQLNEAQNSLSKIGENLGTNAQESASATNEIMANIDSVRKQSKSQSDSVSDTSILLEKSGLSVDELVSSVNSQVNGINQSSAAIEQMLTNITSVTNSVKQMADSFRILGEDVANSNSKIETVSQKVIEMASQSEMLLQANNMISQVASQTNLLAMNAAIEAAHAGESGKGFSVVADEIRKLAETSRVQSKNINIELKGITSSIQNVVTLSKESQESFGAIVTQLTSTDSIMQKIDTAMTEQNAASHQILESLKEMKTQATDVNGKSLELKQSVTSVQSDMISVSQISEVILGSMDEMAAGAREINTAAQSVSDLANRTKENINVMDKLLKQFKV